MSHGLKLTEELRPLNYLVCNRTPVDDRSNKNSVAKELAHMTTKRGVDGKCIMKQLVSPNYVRAPLLKELADCRFARGNGARNCNFL